MKTPRSVFVLFVLMPLIWIMEPPASGAPKGWDLVFFDEFDVPQLDAAKWGTAMEFIGTSGKRFHNPYYASYTLDDEVVLQDGRLSLRTNRREVQGDDPKGSFAFTQGLVSTQNKFAFTYGFIEIRAKYPGGKGIWPCFWLLSLEHAWPPEFDVAEYHGGQRRMHHGLAHGTMHDPLWDSTNDDETEFVETWHTFALEWTAGRAVWYVDGIVKKVSAASYIPSAPMYIVLSNSVSSKAGPSGLPDEHTVFPNSFEIDYVRVYQPALKSLPTETMVVKLETAELPASPFTSPIEDD